MKKHWLKTVDIENRIAHYNVLIIMMNKYRYSKKKMETMFGLKYTKFLVNANVDKITIPEYIDMMSDVILHRLEGSKNDNN